MRRWLPCIAGVLLTLFLLLGLVMNLVAGVKVSDLVVVLYILLCFTPAAAGIALLRRRRGSVGS